jgi:hypothetical protein
VRRLALLLGILGACGAPADDAAAPVETAAVVVTEGGTIALPDPDLRYPDGAQVVRVDEDGTRTVLSEGLAAAGAPRVHHDGTRLLFVGREGADDPFRVYECNADGSGRRVAVDHGSDCVRADYVPDGGIVYAATLPGIPPVSGVGGRTALFVADGEGGAPAQISFGAGLDTDPTILTDGRVLFASWRPSPDGPGRLGLFTIHPDGTGFTPFHLAGADLAYPVQQADGDVRFTQHGTGHPIERIAAWDAPMSVADNAAEPAGETVSLAPRPRPQGQLSSVKPDKPFGTLVCVDARANGTPDAAQIQIATWSGERVVLGRAPLAEDGSFMARVPPDTPFVMQLLDADGKLLREEHGPMWVRSNEVRVCVTCHDDIERAPPNRRPLAVLGEPLDMTGIDR